jgi:SAM-dependent methyltransferase
MLTVDLDRLRVTAGMTVLDVGCGRGRHSLALLQRGCSVLAMDVNLSDLRYTRYLLTATTPDASHQAPGAISPWYVVVQGDALRLPFPTACFDRIICSEVLEHVADPGQTTAELARVLKPGGFLAVSVPTPFTEWAYRFGSDDYFNSPGGHIRIFTPRRLQRLLAGQGLRTLDLGLAHAFHSLYWWMRCVVGLHDESHFLIRHGKKLLTHVMFSSQLTHTERLFDYVFPKSMVLYAHKPHPRDLHPSAS